ncbi:MAG TPA: nuclear transport factor 2 family protein [Micromonosporaceae bacterium]
MTRPTPARTLISGRKQRGDGMSRQSPAIDEGLAAWANGDFDRLSAVLDPDVDLLAAEPGPWDCHGRDAVIALLTERRAEGTQPFEVRIDDLDEHTIVVSRATADDREHVGATVAVIRDEKVVRMQQYPTRAAALAVSRG